jgi:hypothetical protein
VQTRSLIGEHHDHVVQIPVGGSRRRPDRTGAWLSRTAPQDPARRAPHPAPPRRPVRALLPHTARQHPGRHPASQLTDRVDPRLRQIGSRLAAKRSFQRRAAAMPSVPAESSRRFYSSASPKPVRFAHLRGRGPNGYRRQPAPSPSRRTECLVRNREHDHPANWNCHAYRQHAGRSQRL